MRHFSYFHDGETIYLSDPRWNYGRWREASVRGPGIRPYGKYVLVLQDPDPEFWGVLHLPALENANKVSTVLAVPTVHGRPGIRLPKSLLKGGRGVSLEKYRHDNEVLLPLDIRPGDRVLSRRFAGFDCIPNELDQDRLRLVDYFEILGKIEE